MWLKDVFGTHKPVIAMAHLPALPGTPRYSRERGMDFMVDHVAADVEKLVAGGVDALMFCNEDDRPYVLKAGLEQITAMTRVVTEVAPQSIPFGVDFLWDPMAAIAIAHATGAVFIREVFTGLYESDMGIWSPNAGEVMRFRERIGAEHVRVFYNIVPEFAVTLGTRDIAQRARSVAVSCLPDGILISGLMAGEEPDIRFFQDVKAVVKGIPLLLNTGATPENIKAYLQVADGVIVGSSLKVDGYTWNAVDPDRVKRFMDVVHRVRDSEKVQS
ncbi:MAG: BtpA/SgcQ family protein [Chloroflexi bacterium]|nr:MAG: BtpA/SgcQ family protein [Chloroflexota bacterium]